MIVTSARNAQLKLVRRLQRRRARQQEQAFVVEGEDLVLAGLETGAPARLLLVDSERVPDLDPSLVPCPVLHVEPQLLAEASGLAHPPRALGVFGLPPLRPFSELRALRTGPWLVLDGIADPGNVGTILRSAAAFGAAGVAAGPGSADPWSPKAVRASMGAIFRLPVTRIGEGPASLVEELVAARSGAPGMRIVALHADGDVPLWDVPLEGATLVVGGEREGVAAELLAAADDIAAIPQDPAVDSINAAVAAGVALYEWRRSSPERRP